VEQLLGDPTKARTTMGWECKVRFRELVRDMMAHDLKDVVSEDGSKRCSSRLG
jgi:GDPmannose 4,6-dehydratase